MGTNVAALIKPSESGLTIPDDLPFEEWERLGERIANTARNLQWFWGDWLNFGEKRYGEKYKTVVEKFGLKLSTAQKYAWVAATYEPCKRLQVSWSHHHEVAGIADESERTLLLEKTENEGWSVRRLKQEIDAPIENRLVATTPGELKATEPDNDNYELAELIGDLRTTLAKYAVKFGKDRLSVMARILADEAESMQEACNAD